MKLRISKIPDESVKTITCVQMPTLGNKLRINAIRAPPANHILISCGSLASMMSAKMKTPSQMPKYHWVVARVIIFHIVFPPLVSLYMKKGAFYISFYYFSIINSYKVKNLKFLIL
jgi:hypothetical protein